MIKLALYHPQTINHCFSPQHRSGQPCILTPQCSGDQLGRRGKWPVSDSSISSNAPLKCGRVILSPLFLTSLLAFTCVFSSESTVVPLCCLPHIWYLMLPLCSHSILSLSLSVSLSLSLSLSLSRFLFLSVSKSLRCKFTLVWAFLPDRSYQRLAI